MSSEIKATRKALRTAGFELDTVGDSEFPAMRVGRRNMAWELEDYNPRRKLVRIFPLLPIYIYIERERTIEI